MSSDHKNTSYVFGQHVSSMSGMKRTRVAPLTEDIQDVVVDVTVRRSKIEGLDTKNLDKGIFDLR